MALVPLLCKRCLWRGRISYPEASEKLDQHLVTRLLFSFFVLTCALGSTAAQDPETDALLEEKTEIYRKLVKGRDQEGALIAHLDGFVTIYSKDQKRVVEIDEILETKPDNKRDLEKEKKGLRKRQKEISDSVFYVFRRKRMTEPHMRLWRAAIAAFGQMPTHGAAPLWKIFEDKRFSREVEIRSKCVLQVGYTRDLRQGDALLDLLDDKDELVAAAAGDALSQFRNAPGQFRKEATKDLVKMLESNSNAASTKDASTTDIRRFRTVKDPFLRALTTFTGQSFRKPLDWTRWWNKNKNDRSLWKDS